MKNKKYGPLLFWALLFLSQLSFGQHNIVGVSKFTGTPNVVIPIYNVTCGQASLPVNLVYSTSGVHVKDVEGSAGMNWQLIAGGQVTRELRGLPDDCLQDRATNGRVGWMYSTVHSAITGFTPTGSASDITYINSNFNNTQDSEPDLFDVSAPGLSAQLIYDPGTSSFKTTSYSDLKIESGTPNPTTGQIPSFTITNNQGIKYVFDVCESGMRQTFLAPSTTFSYFNNDYLQYQNGILYISTWRLSSVTDRNGNGIRLDYDFGDTRAGQDPVTLKTAEGLQVQYNVTTTNTPFQLSTISTQMGLDPPLLYLTFTYSGNYYTNKSIVTSITGAGRNFQLSYTTATSPSSTTGYARNFLTSVFDTGCASPGGYQFNYTGVTYSSGTGYTTTLPDSTSMSIDYWGYFNGAPSTGDLVPAIDINPTNPSYERYRNGNTNSPSGIYPYILSGASRKVGPAFVDAGVLNKITYAEGGTTTLTYEPNDYYDNTAALVNTGGGVRVKKIEDYDGQSTANTIVRNYAYTDPATGLSSGKPVTLPIYAFTRPYDDASNTLAAWTNATVRSDTDLSPDDHTVIYGVVTESETGAGSTASYFTTPATMWNPMLPSDWAPTTEIATTTGTGVGHWATDTYTYPFLPNPNYDFERGLLTKSISYNDASAKVSETDYTYTRTATGALPAIQAFKFELNNGSGYYQYNKYVVNTGTSELSTQVVNTVYDANDQSTSRQTTTTFTYGSPYHKLMTQQQVTNSDGSINTTHIAYVKDFVVPFGDTDPTAIAIANLTNMNVNVPLEQYSQVIPAGGSTALTTGANLSIVAPYSFPSSSDLYLLSQKRNYFSKSGVSDFTPASIDPTTHAFTYDSRYFVTENEDAYDYTGNIQTKDDGNRHVQGLVIDRLTYKPVATIANGANSDMAFSDFDSNTTNSFTKATYTLTTDSRTGKYALSLEAGTPMTITGITKNANAANNIFSYWIKTSTAGTMTISVNSGGTPYTYSLGYGATGAWAYYQLKVPLTGLSSSFNVSFQTDGAVTIDDILLYPETSSVSTVAYDPVTYYPTANTNTNGLSNYFSYDAFGRSLFTYDQDKNITDRKIYNNNFSGTPAAPSFMSTSSATNNTATGILFLAGYIINDCYNAGTTYTWDFGDGSPNSTLSNPTHYFATAGIYTVTLNYHSPTFGELFTSQSNIVINTYVPPPAQVPIHFANYASGGDLNYVEFDQGGSMIAIFTKAQILAGATIAEGIYDITVHCTGASGDYGSVHTYTNTNSACNNFVRSNVYTLPMMDLTGAHYFQIDINPDPCP